MRRALVIGLVAAALLLVVAACEDSTSGADRVHVDVEAGPDADLLADAGGDGKQAEARAPSTCVSCANAKCGDQVSSCGAACDTALNCVANCVAADCESRCFRAAATATATAFKACMVTKCSSDCKVFTDLVTGGAAYATADCEKVQACAPQILNYRFGSLDNCKKRGTTALVWSALLPASGATGTVYRTCASSYEALDCTDYFSARGGFACQPRGDRLLGEPCLDDAQCETGFCPAVDFACSTCTAAPGPGKPCLGDRCGPGLLCSSGTCVPPARLGEACSNMAPCEGTTTCNGGTCKASSTVAGTACGAGTLGCDVNAGLLCVNSGTASCTPFEAVGAGAPCRVLSGGKFQQCQLATTCAGSCAPAPKAGEACDLVAGPRCTYPDRCIDSKCVELPPLDACP